MATESLKVDSKTFRLVDPTTIDFTGATILNFDSGLGYVPEDAANKDNDTFLTSDSATLYPTQHAVKTYVDNLAASVNAVIFKGIIDCSGNPNYPAADRGFAYIISVAGKIGGASGLNVQPRDLIICLDDGTPSGNQATVGIHWTLVQANIDGTVIGPLSSTDSDFAQFDGVTGALIKDGGLSLDTDNTLAADSDSRIASQQAVKAYVDNIAGGGSVTSVAATAPAAGFTIAGSPITSTGTFLFALANDLAALEAFSSTGIAKRTGSDTWIQISDTTVGDSLLTLGNPGAVTFIRINADNTVTARSASQIRTDLDLEIGIDVQAWDADLDTLAGLTPTTDNFIISVASAWASRTPTQARTTLGLVIGTNVQAWSADLDAIDALTGTGIIPYRSALNTWGNVTIGSDMNFASGVLSAAHQVTFVVDGSGSVLTTGTKNPIKIPFGGVLQGWAMMCKPSGSVTADIFRAVDGAGLPVTSIIGGGGTKPASRVGHPQHSMPKIIWRSAFQGSRLRHTFN